MTRNYNLSENDYNTIYSHWDADAHETYGVDFNGCWYKTEEEQ